MASIVLLAYVPSYRELPALRVSERDSFHHWDFFVMGLRAPFQRLAGHSDIETYSQYGVGYPLLVSSIMGGCTVSYGTLIRLGMSYGCIYLIVLAVGLRIALASRFWSICCVLMCMLLQYFHGVNAYDTIWTFPSSSILRYATDVWFFLALVIHYRTGHRLAVLAAVPWLVSRCCLCWMLGSTFWRRSWVAWHAASFSAGLIAGNMTSLRGDNWLSRPRRW